MIAGLVAALLALAAAIGAAWAAHRRGVATGRAEATRDQAARAEAVQATLARTDAESRAAETEEVRQILAEHQAAIPTAGADLDGLIAAARKRGQR